MKILILILLLVGCSQNVSLDNSQDMENNKDIIEDGSLSPYEKYLDYAVLKDDFEIKDFLHTKGDSYEYATYYLESVEDYYYSIVVIDENIKTINSDKNIYASLKPLLEDLIYEVDINVDGANDILICQGGFGTQGSKAYSCFLKSGDEFIEVEDFSSLSNPKIDMQTGEILTEKRGNAYTYIYEIAKMENNALNYLRKITYSVELDQQIITEEYYTDGQWQLSAKYYIDDISNFPDINPENIWSESFLIGNEKWETLMPTLIINN